MAMSHIQGIGGFFFRAQDPAALKQWYIDVLGVEINEMIWQQTAGPTVLEPFAKDTDYFGPKTDQQWMLNFRVDDLQLLIKELRSKGVEVEERDEWNEMADTIGTFARVYDPEGNPIELWQPVTK